MSDLDGRKIGKHIIPVVLFAILSGYMLVTGRLRIDKRQATIVMRSSDPPI